MADDGVKEFLLRLVDEVEDIRAHQAVTTQLLIQQSKVHVFDVQSAVGAAKQRNQQHYDQLRKAIEELS